MNRRGSNQAATIANGGTTSTVIDLVDAITAGVVLPAAFTGTALTFQVSHDGTTFQALTDQYGNAVSMTVAQGKSYTIPNEVAPWPFAKIVSGSSEAAARTLWIVRKH